MRNKSQPDRVELLDPVIRRNEEPVRKSPLLGTLLAIALLPSLAAAPAAAQGARAGNAAEVLALVSRTDGKTRYQGRRTQQCIRQDMVLDSDAKIDFVDNDNYQINVQSPREIKGLNLVLEKGKMNVFFPGETLLFQNDNPVGSDEVKDLILGRLTADTAALQKNYKITLDPEMDVVALYPCYKLTMEPANGYGPQSPPGHRFWVARETGIIMKEERFWGADQAAYFMSRFDSLSLTARPAINLALPAKINKLKMATGTATEMRRFATVGEARAAGKKIYLPTDIPQGFKLRNVDVMTLYGSEIVLLRYNDGLSNLVVTYRTKPNMFLTLMAGAFALSLVDKISKLSYHAPNNYAVIEKGEYLVYTYGDIWVETLKNVANTVNVPLAPEPAKQGLLPLPAFGLAGR